MSTLAVSLLLGALAFVSVGLFVFLCRRFFARKAKGASVGGAVGGEPGPGQGAGAGQSKALNDLVEWVFGQPRQGEEEWTNVLARALTQQAAKNKSPEDFKLRVEKISNFENAPQFSRLSSHRSPLDNSLVVRAEVLWKRFELSLSLTPGPTSHGALYSVVSRVIVFEFQSSVEGVLRSSSDNVTVLTAKFPTEPKMKLDVKQDHEVDIDSAKLERLVRKTISETEFRFPFSAQNRFGSLPSAQPERFELQNKNRTTSAADELLGTLLDRKRKLLVRIIKASGLVTSQERDYGSHQHFCVAIMDNPMQRYMTSSVKNTANPFFDELFALDVDQMTKKLTFEVHDKDRPEDDDFLGMAVLTADDFSRNRHVLPLTGRGPMTFGSLTVEVSIVDSDQVPSILATSHNVQHITTPESPIVLVSEPEEISVLPTPDIPTETLRDSASTTLPVGYLPPKGDAKKKSLVGAIKKRFGRKKTKGNPRSQSADRAQEEKGSWSSSSQASHYGGGGGGGGGEGVYLTPSPSRASALNLESDDQRSQTSERRSRSNSLRKSLSGFFRSGRSPGRPGDSPSTPLPYGQPHPRRFDRSPEGSVVAGIGGSSPSPSPRGSATPHRQPSPQPSTSGLTPSGSEQRFR